MTNNAAPYIAAVAAACTTAGLNVADWWTDDIDPRDGGITLSLTPGADLEESWELERVLGWDEERGWIFGEVSGPHGSLRNILYICSGELPEPADVADQARKVIAGEYSTDEFRTRMHPVQYRETDDDDGFESQLAAYITASTGESKD